MSTMAALEMLASHQIYENRLSKEAAIRPGSVPVLGPLSLWLARKLVGAKPGSVKGMKGSAFMKDPVPQAAAPGSAAQRGWENMIKRVSNGTAVPGAPAFAGFVDPNAPAMKYMINNFLKSKLSLKDVKMGAPAAPKAPAPLKAPVSGIAPAGTGTSGAGATTVLSNTAPEVGGAIAARGGRLKPALVGAGLFGAGGLTMPHIGDAASYGKEHILRPAVSALSSALEPATNAAAKIDWGKMGKEYGPWAAGGGVIAALAYLAMNRD